MSTRTLSEMVAAALAAALGSRSTTLVGAQMTMMEADVEKKRVSKVVLAGMAKNGYGIVLEGRNDFRTSASTGTVDHRCDALKLEPKGTCLIIKPPRATAA